MFPPSSHLPLLIIITINLLIIITRHRHRHPYQTPPPPPPTGAVSHASRTPHAATSGAPTPPRPRRQAQPRRSASPSPARQTRGSRGSLLRAVPVASANPLRLAVPRGRAPAKTRPARPQICGPSPPRLAVPCRRPPASRCSSRKPEPPLPFPSNPRPRFRCCRSRPDPDPAVAAFPSAPRATSGQQPATPFASTPLHDQQPRRRAPRCSPCALSRRCPASSPRSVPLFGPPRPSPRCSSAFRIRSRPSDSVIEPPGTRILGSEPVSQPPATQELQGTRILGSEPVSQPPATQELQGNMMMISTRVTFFGSDLSAEEALEPNPEAQDSM